MSFPRFDPTRHLARLESPGRHRRQAPALVLPLLPSTGGGLAAELGCGTGFFGRVLARHLRPRPYLGLDPSRALLEHFRQSLSPVDLETAALVMTERERLPLATGSISLLFMANVMHELLADAGILPEIRRVTAPGGHLFLVDWKKRPTMAGPPFFLKVSRARAMRTFRELGFRSLPIPQVYRHHYCLLFAKNPEREAR